MKVRKKKYMAPDVAMYRLVIPALQLADAGRLQFLG